MKPSEYRRLLEEHIECSMLEREKRAYRMALAMFLMVEMPREGTKTEPAAGEGKADPVIDNAPAPAAGEGKADPVIGNAPEQAAEEGKADPVIGNAPEQAAEEGKADPVIDNAPEQAAGEKKRVYNFKKKKCIKCGEMFTPSYGPQKMCRDCATKIADGKITPTTSDKDSKKEAMIIVDKL